MENGESEQEILLASDEDTGTKAEPLPKVAQVGVPWIEAEAAKVCMADVTPFIYWWDK